MDRFEDPRMGEEEGEGRRGGGRGKFGSSSLIRRIETREDFSGRSSTSVPARSTVADLKDGD